MKQSTAKKSKKNQVSPGIAAAIILVVVLIAAVLIWRGSSQGSGHYSKKARAELQEFVDNGGVVIGKSADDLRKLGIKLPQGYNEPWYMQKGGKPPTRSARGGGGMMGPSGPTKSVPTKEPSGGE